VVEGGVLVPFSVRWAGPSWASRWA
jgi:hypothetical protein